MRTTVPEKLLKVIDDIDTQGNASLTRLTVLKKWFEHPGRLQVFGLWVARQAAGRKGKTQDGAAALLDEARALLGSAATRESLFQQIARETAQTCITGRECFRTISRSSNTDRCGLSTAGRCCWWKRGWPFTPVSIAIPAAATNWLPTGRNISTPVTATA